MAQFKAVILDIDGTLVYAGRRQVSPACLAALACLQAAGVLVVFATGRGTFASADNIAPGFLPDYKVCSNGAVIVNAAGKRLFEDRLTRQQVEALADFATQKHHLSVCFTFEEGYYDYSNDGSFIKYYTGVMGTVDFVMDGSDQTRHLQSLPFSCYMVLPPALTSEFDAAFPDFVRMESFTDSYDVCHTGMNKAVGIGHLLEIIGLGWDEVLAMGDSENDITMLHAAGHSVAMGEAAPHVCAAAKEVGPGVHEDGVLLKLQKYFPDICRP